MANGQYFNGAVVANVSESQQLLGFKTKAEQGLTNPVQIYADQSVWDTVANKFLRPNFDYQPSDLFRS